MTRPAPSKAPVALLFLLCCGIGAGLYHVVVNDPFTVKADLDPATVGKTTPVNIRVAGFNLPPRTNFSDIVVRPLFNETRRPPAPVVKEAPAPAPKQQTPITFEITGILISPTERIAIVRDNRASVVRAHEGQEINGWIVEAIKVDRVVFRQGDRQEELKLRDKNQKPGKTPLQRRIPNKRSQSANTRTMQQANNR